MSNIDKLIASIKRRPCIWDPNRHSYHDRSLVKAAWEEISRECDIDEAVARTKWKGLRDTFRHELKKQIRIHMSPASSKIRHRGQTWVWFQKMQFIKNTLKAKQPPRQDPVTMQETETSIRDVSNKEPETRSEENSFSQSMPTSPTIPNEDEIKPFSLMEILENGLEPITSNGRRRRVTEHDEEIEFASRRDTTIEEYSNADTLHDSVYHFAMSLVPIMRQLPFESQLRCRIRMQEMLLSELEKQNNSMSSVGICNLTPKVEPYSISDDES